jgi:hypothetical protein
MIWDNTNKPNFFLVGAAKSGTTSLSSWLDSHPDLYVSPIKEPNYFSTDIDVSKFRKGYLKSFEAEDSIELKPLKKRQIAFLRDEELYAQLFKPNNFMVHAGECSTSYLYSDAAAESIHAFNSDSKILIMLRNPLERAYSHYLMAVQMGLESNEFLSAFKRDMNKADKGWGVSELYFELGQYSQQLKRFLKVFPENQIKVVLFEDWIQQPKETQESICKFLNVSIFAALQNEVLNKSVSPKNPRLHRFLMQSGLKDLVKKVLPKEFFDKIKGGQYKGEKEVLAPEERKYLVNLYRDEILELQGLIKRDLSNWLK